MLHRLSIGPFPNRQGMGFRRQYPPEKDIDLSATYVAGYGEAEWYQLDRGAKFDDDKVEATLKKGVNTVLFKVCEDWGAWQLLGRITGPGDTPLKNVRITTDPP